MQRLLPISVSLPGLILLASWGGMTTEVSALTLSGSVGYWSNPIIEQNANTRIQYQTFGFENQIRWGIPATSGAPNSALGFTGVGATTFNPGDIFQLGTLRHYNNPVFAPSPTAVDLSLNLAFSNPGISQNFRFTFNINETPNNLTSHPGGVCPYFSITPCSDRIAWSNAISSNTFNVGGINYQLELLGFRNSPTGGLVTEFISQENQINTVSLFGRLVEINNPPVLNSFTLNGTEGNIGIWEGESVTANLSASDRQRLDDISFFLNNNYVGIDTTDTTGNRNLNTFLGTFNDNGTYTYTAQARDSQGANSNTLARSVTVYNVAPTLYGFNQVINEGQWASGTLTATDPGSDPVTFWFNGNTLGTDYRTSGTRSMDVNLGYFANNGQFTYWSRANDDDGGYSNWVVNSLTVLNVAPTLTQFQLNGQNSDIIIDEGQSVTSQLVATDPGMYDNISFFLNGNFQGTDYTDTTGDRTLSTNLGTFGDNGQFTYTAQARDSDSANSNTLTRNVIVRNVGPTLTQFDLSSYEIFEGQSISAFLAATDPGQDAISFFLNGTAIGTDWDLSGVRTQDWNLGTFADDGLFNFTGQARDDDSAWSNALSRTLRVVNVAPTITSLTQNLSVLVGENFRFDVSAFDPGIYDLLSYEWDLDGDGLFDDFLGISGDWSFLNAGSYQVAVRVSDGDGGVTTQSFSVLVRNPELPDEPRRVPEPSLGWASLGAIAFFGSRLRRR